MNNTAGVNDSEIGANGTKNGTEDTVMISLLMTIVMWIMYMGITALSLIGNGLVCYIVLAFKRMRTVTNIFIVNLAVGDVMMAALCIPFTFVANLILEYWPFGAIMCPLVGYAQAVTVFTSAYTLIAISIDRYIAILYPLKPRLTKFYAKMIICIVWMVALITPIPTVMTSRLKPHPAWINSSVDRYLCQEIWEEPSQKYYYSLVLMILQFFFPLAVLVFTYIRIAIVVWGKKTPGEAEDSRDKKLAKSKRKMVAMMIVVVTVFTACWLPFNILVTVGDQDPSVWRHPYIRYIWFSVHWLAMSHTCYNPLIYCWMNVKFREGFNQLCSRTPCCAFKFRAYQNNLRRCGTITTTYSSVKRIPGTTLRPNINPRSSTSKKVEFKWNGSQNDVLLRDKSSSLLKYKSEYDDSESQV